MSREEKKGAKALIIFCFVFLTPSFNQKIFLTFFYEPNIGAETLLLLP